MTIPPPFIPYGRHQLTDDDLRSVENVLRSPFLTQGPVVPEFELSICERVGSNHAVAVNSATSALHIACLALGLQHGDTLWTTPITFVASANCARFCGADVDFVDINPTTGLICIDSLESKLLLAERSNKLPKIVVPVHLAGSSCDMEAIALLAKRYGFSVIEDASHAIGGSYKNKPIGSCSYSSITVFSFHPVKIITSGEGGIATTNDSYLAQRMVDLRSHGIVRDQNRFQLASQGTCVYEQHDLGFNYRLTDIQAALGLSQLSRLDTIVKERNRLLRVYHDLLSHLPLYLLHIPSDVYSSVHLAIVRLINCDPKRHQHIFSDMRSAGIGVQLHYAPVHLQPYYRNLGFSDGQFPEAEKYAQSAISLPLFPQLKHHEQKYVVSVLERLLI